MSQVLGMFVYVMIMLCRIHLSLLKKVRSWRRLPSCHTHHTLQILRHATCSFFQNLKSSFWLVVTSPDKPLAHPSVIASEPSALHSDKIRPMSASAIDTNRKFIKHPFHRERLVSNFSAIRSTLC